MQILFRLSLTGLTLATISSSALATSGFAFLGLQPDSRCAAMADSRLAGVEGVSGLFQNPASPGSLQENQVQFLWLDHLQDINYFNTSLSLKRFQPWTLNLAISHLNYGSLEGRDIYNRPTGEFKASDNLLAAGVSRGFGSLRVGVLGKLGLSSIDDSRASLLALDLGLSWTSESDWSLAATLRNAGTVLSDYGSSDTPLPTAFSLGVEKKLRHLPFRWALAWEQVKEEDPWIKAGGEFLIARRWHLGLGYHFGRGEDRLSSGSGEGTRGLNLGIGGLIAGGIHFHWAWSSFGELGALNRFTLSRSF